MITTADNVDLYFRRYVDGEIGVRLYVDSQWRYRQCEWQLESASVFRLEMTIGTKTLWYKRATNHPDISEYIRDLIEHDADGLMLACEVPVPGVVGEWQSARVEEELNRRREAALQG